MRYEYKTKGVCARSVSFDIDDDGNVTNVLFFGGCDGNLKAISKLVDGWNADKINEILRGNTCGYKSTSCADQLAIAVMQAKSKVMK